MHAWSRTQWYGAVLGAAALLGILVSMPYALHVQDARYRGVPVHLNADEWSYLPRVQEVLESGPARLGVAIAGGEELLPPLQAGLLEQVYGVLFRPFTQRASTVFLWMDFAVPLLLFIVLVGFLRACGIPRRRAFAAAALFSLLELYNLGRPVHQGASFLLAMLSLWGLLEGVQRRRAWGFLGGVLMGLLTGVYFWSFTAAWVWWGLLLLCYGYCREWRRVRLLVAFGAAGLAAAAPFLIGMRRLAAHPLYEEVFFRSGIGHSRMPESWPWTVLFLVMAAGMLLLRRRSERISPPVLCTVWTAFILLNQHLLHGTLFLFASHYLFTLAFAAVVALAAVWGDRSKAGVAVTVAATVFLLGIGYDNRSVIAQWRLDDEDFAEQHLASAIPALDALDRTVVLSDPLTSSFIASHTRHDVLFTHYIQHELRSHRELAERYCLTQLPVVPGERHPEQEHVLVYGAAYDAIFDSVEKARVRAEELLLVREACMAVDADPSRALAGYGISYILWDEARQPAWDMGKIPGQLTQVARGAGWSLWRLEVR